MEKIGTTIAKKRKEAKLSQGELAERMGDFGFNPSAASVSSWEKDVSVPNALQFLALCKVLGIRNINGEFLKDEIGIGDPFGGLNAEGRKRAEEYIALLLLSDEYREKKKTPEILGIDKAIRRIDKTEKGDKVEIKIRPAATRIIKLFDLPVSAGTGEFLDGEDYEEVEVGEEVSASADFGLRIKGNSMEPRYKDGQTVWVKSCKDLSDGEIGIFLLNGDAYCKKLKKDKDGVSLISLNPSYKPIRIKDGDVITILGKVLG
ncbi:MAG: helix-turn-helix domain-containing protein [Lachnospiraceae bacterium]|nr:helix-turn-helix domain-containing protein [Lachnospiraceae bacterium]